MGDWRYGQPLTLFEAVEELVNKYSDDGVGEAGDSDMTPAPLKRLAEQAMSDAEVHGLVHDEENISHQKARAGVLDVDFHADRRCRVADDGVGNTVHADGMSRAAERVLQQADDGSGNATGDGIAAGDGEEDHHHHRQVDDGEPTELCADERLDQNCDQRYEDDYEQVEFVNRNLFS